MTTIATQAAHHQHSSTKPRAFQRCTNAACRCEYPVTEVRVSCTKCGSLLDVAYRFDKKNLPTWEMFEERALTKGARNAAGAKVATNSMLDFSGVWRFRDLLPFYQDESKIVTIGEGRTNLQKADQVAKKVGMNLENGGALYLQYEGFNPSGSFKDNGMTAGFTHARMVNATRVACASTGNTSASLGVYAALTGMTCFVFIGDGKIAYGKLSQALEYGAVTLQVAGDFDACLARVRQIAETMPEVGVYLMNSVNPFRLEGQKSIMYRVLEGLDWQVPDWIVVPGGNLGNCSAFGKAFIELKALGLIQKVPRLAVIQAKGSRTLDRIYNDMGVRWTSGGGEGMNDGDVICPDLSGSYDESRVKEEYARMDRENERAHTVATAIEINRPVNLSKSLRALHAMNGVVRSVDDPCIVEHKALVGHYGFGCEPASGASVAGVRNLIREGVIKPTETVVGILTGHVLKDPDVTVAYHTGIDMKGGKSGGGKSKGDISIPLGGYVNRPVRVADEIGEILRAMGVK